MRIDHTFSTRDQLFGLSSGAGYGDFLLGLASAHGLTLFHGADLYSDGWQFYAQDSWRLTSDLTLNYGLRYEYFTPARHTITLGRSAP